MPTEIQSRPELVETDGLDMPKGRAAKRKLNNAQLSNPYLAARHAWDERYGDLISRARHWRMAAFVAMAIAAVAVGGLVVIARQTRLVPFIVAVDSVGRPLASGVASPESFKLDERIMKVTVADFIVAWRGVTSDWELQKRQIEKVYGMIAQGSSAQVAITDWYRRDPPDKRGLQGTVEVEILSVLTTSDRSWEVQWTETKRLATGQFQDKEDYRGVVTVAVNPPKSEADGRINPLGVFLTKASWARVYTK